MRGRRRWRKASGERRLWRRKWTRWCNAPTHAKQQSTPTITLGANIAALTKPRLKCAFFAWCNFSPVHGCPQKVNKSQKAQKQNQLG